MYKSYQIAGFLIFINAIYLAGSYYIYRHVRKLGFSKPVRRSILVIQLSLVLMYPVAMIFGMNSSLMIFRLLRMTGNFYLAVMLYAVLIIFIIDITNLLDRRLGILPEKISLNKRHYARLLSIASISVILALMVVGYINTTNIKVRTYKLSLPKKSGSGERLKLAFISDVHLSNLTTKAFVNRTVNTIKSVDPDIVIFGGDIIDRNAADIPDLSILSSLGDLKPRLGIFGVMGNHDFFGDIPANVACISKCGIRLLRDESVEIGGDFILAGRDDRSVARFAGRQRKTLSEVLNKQKKSLPVIVIDHTPFNLEDSRSISASLQLSGHTHNGQFFPLNLFVKYIYELGYGYMKNEDTHYIVSSGAGTWGPAVRLGSSSEIVLVDIDFN